MRRLEMPASIKFDFEWRLILFFFICIHQHLSAQSPPDFRLISVQEGLSHRDVKYTTRDPRGFLWIINAGIDFYDGQTFTSYNKFDPDHFIPIDNIRTGCKVMDSLLVFTAAKDLFALNMLTGKCRPMSYPEGMNMNFNDVVNIIDRQHHPNILIFTRTNTGTIINVIDQQWKYLFSYEVRNDVPLRSKIIRAYANGPDGVIWLLDEAHAQILRIDQKGVSSMPFPFEVGDPELMYRLVYLPGYGLVICRNNGQIYAVKDNAASVQEVMRIPMTEKVLNPSHVTANGWIWSISDNQFVKFHVQTQAYEMHDVKMFGPYHPILRNSYQDSEGISWISTEVGLLAIQPNAKLFYQACVDPDGVRQLQFREIFQTDERSFICRALGQRKVLLKVTLDRYLHPDTSIVADGVSYSGIFRKYKNHLYHILSGEPVVIRYDLDTYLAERIALPARPTTQFYNLFVIDSSGMLWYQDMNNQLTGFHPDTKETRMIPLQTENIKSPWRVLEFFSADEIMIATETMGLLFFNRKDGRMTRHYNQESSPALSGNFINAICMESDSVLWIGLLGAGLNRLNMQRGTNKVFTKLDGLPDNVIASLAQDAAGNVWIGTYSGLSMYHTSDHRFYNYFREDGLSNNEFNYLSSCVSRDGTILMGTFNGLTVFDPKIIIGNAPLPAVQITRIQRYNRMKNATLTEEHDPDANDIIYVSAYDNYIDLSFAVPSYISNTSHEFFTRLKGIDEDWQSHGSSNTVRYQKLPAGRYELELMATDAHGNKTVNPAIITLQVQQIFYKSWWFLLLMAALLLSSVVAIYKYRLRFLRKEMETRTRIASDLHDEVGGSLTGLYLQLQMMEMNAGEQEKSRLTKANFIINEAITKMRDLVWSIDARSDSWGKMIERMEDYASDVLSPLDIQFSIDHHSISMDTPIDARTKHNIYLIYKEAIHNIAKHSNASVVTLKLEKHTDGLKFVIQDNGKASEIRMRRGQGLHNIQMRAERLKGKLHSGFTEAGFVVEVDFPKEIL